MTFDPSVPLGDRIRILREELGFSLGELEKQCGVTKGYLSQLERGEARNPSLEAVRRIGDALGVSLATLAGEGAPDPADERKKRVPAGLQTFLDRAEAEGRPLLDEDVEMLLGIRYRGRPPKTADDFALLYDFIRRLVR